MPPRAFTDYDAVFIERDERLGTSEITERPERLERLERLKRERSDKFEGERGDTTERRADR
jgi:hypothetical protein